MVLFLSITGIILSIILISYNTRRLKSTIYLGGVFFLVSLYGLIQYVLIYSGSVFLVGLTYINPAFLTYLIGPMIYLYVRSLLRDDSGFTRNDIWHLLPALIFFITSIPYMFTPWQVKLDHASEIVNNVNYLGRNKATVLYEILPSAVIYLSRPLVVLVYVIMSATLFVRYLKKKKESSVFKQQRYMITWLSVLLGSLFILAASQVLMVNEAFTHRSSQLFFTFNLLQILSASGIAGLLISPFFFPGILYGLPRVPDPPEEFYSKPSMVFLSKEIVIKMPGLESEYLNLIRQKLESCMKEQQPFLQPDCNLATVSKCIEVPVHHLAYYFREVRKQSFNDYRNKLRVDQAKELIREGKAKELTLEAIGLLSGFSTRNTFFKAFKKIEGETPSMYSSKY